MHSNYTTFNMDPEGNTRFYGVYRATVVDNIDGEDKGRLSLVIPQINGSETIDNVPGAFSADVSIPVSETLIPDLGTSVWVMFENGETEYPVWIGIRL
ncbi:hypothetical protein UFOVP621_22 [uncultured Caudovirales phage]|uniref:Gp5/Type VI secretion system Vgr protein OB-fold domain-containing protein n=1 Tax=uncultured Caudovirales phage TaxID=2100421 RepID=A0A6J5N1W9_9CAUD|nr:hypothetical protein UFOVP621_22 [uncultured Caudovirales phage]